MDFGFSLKPLFSIERTVALTKQAEAAGFSYGWLFDGHVLWKEVYPLLTVMALNTSDMRLGTCVTNPATREPSVTASALATFDEISGGRMDLGIGRGDNAVRVLGKPPTTMKTLEAAVTVIRDLVEGQNDRVRRGRPGAALDRQVEAAGMDRRLRTDGTRDDRSHRRRADPATGRCRSHPLDGRHDA